MASHLDRTYTDQPLQRLQTKVVYIGRAFIAAAGEDGFFTIRSGARHPWIVLIGAVLGTLVVSRRSLFLWAGFLGGLAPSLISDSMHANAHRMLMAFPFVAIAAGCALDWPKQRTTRLAAAFTFLLIAGAQSVLLYFSPEFWPLQSRTRFEWQTSALVEALPPAPHPRLILQKFVGYYFNPRALVDSDYEYLAVDNWYPPNEGSLYAFTWHTKDLVPFYEDLFGTERMERFGNGFLLRLEKRDWSWVQQHGWSYEATCGDVTRFGRVPTLYFYMFDFPAFGCEIAMDHTWRGRWNGPPSTLRLVFSGDATVQTSAGVARTQHGYEQSMDFTVEPGLAITVTISTPPNSAGVTAILQVMNPAGAHLPPWDYVSPIEDETS